MALTAVDVIKAKAKDAVVVDGDLELGADLLRQFYRLAGDGCRANPNIVHINGPACAAVIPVGHRPRESTSGLGGGRQGRVVQRVAAGHRFGEVG